MEILKTSVALLIFFSCHLAHGQYTVRRIIETPNAPRARDLPLSQAVQVDNMVYVSGTLGMNVDGELANGIRNQTILAFTNIGHILNAAGSSLSRVVKVTVLLSDLDNYDVMNEVYGTYFTNRYPARAAYQVARLPRDALIEIEVVAMVGSIVDI